MKIEGNKLDFISDKYERAMEANALHVEKFVRNYQQYNGTHAIEGGVDATIVRNITREIIEGQVDCRIPYPKVTSQCTDEKHVHNARCIERLCDYYTKKGHFPKFNDADERQTYIFGASIYLAEFDNSTIDGNAIGTVEARLIHPKFFAPQPGIARIEDMDYLFVDIPMPREEVKRQYGVEVPEDEGDMEDFVDGEYVIRDTSDDIVLIHVCYYKDKDGNVCQYIWTDGVEILDVDDYYARKVEVCETCGRRRELCEKDPCENPDYVMQSAEEITLDADILDENGNVLIPAMTQEYKDGVPQFDEELRYVYDQNGALALRDMGGYTLPIQKRVQIPRMVPTVLPYYKPKRFPIVIRPNTSAIDGDWCGVSDCDVIRDQQILINKLESRMAKKLLRAGVMGVVPKGATQRKIDNGVFDTVLEIGPQFTKGQFGSITTEVPVTQDVATVERQYEGAKRVAGITNAYVGQSDTTAKSGYAKQIQVQQSAGRLESKRVMKNSSYAELYRIFFELTLAYGDELRPLCDKDEEGGACTIHFDRNKFYYFDKQSGKWMIDDNYLFEADYNGTPEDIRAQMWELNMANFEKGMFGDVASNETRLRYWIKQEKARYPFAYEEVSYYRQLVERERAQVAMMQLQMQQAQAGQNAQMPAVQTERMV